MIRLCAYHKSAKTTKLQAITDAYKLDYLDCINGSALLYIVRYEEVDVVNMEEAEAKAAEDAVFEDDRANEGVVDEMMANVTEQAGGTKENMANQVDAKQAER